MVTVMNGTRAWWLCQCGHEWQAIIASRSQSTGCPACVGQVVVAGVNDLGSRMPSVAAECHPVRNALYTPAAIAVYSRRMMLVPV